MTVMTSPQLEQSIFATLLSLTLSCSALLEAYASQGQRQQLIARVQQVCIGSKANLEQMQLPDLKRKQTAYTVLIKDWREKMPAHLRENMPLKVDEWLDLVAAALEILFASYDTSEFIIRECGKITEDTDQQTISQLGNAIRRVDDTLVELQTDFAGKLQSRQGYKSSMDKSVDLMIQYNGSKESTYTKIKVELDPKSLDQSIGMQRKILSPVKLGLDFLK